MVIARDRPFYIAGAGRVATAIARKLASKGCDVQGVGARNLKEAYRVAGLCNAFSGSLSDLADRWRGKGHLILAVSDDAIRTVWESLIGSVDSIHQDVCVLHTSGYHRAEALRAPSENDLHALAFHPVTSFGTTDSDPFPNTLITLQGGKDSVEFGMWLAEILGGHGVEVTGEQKQAIHAASALMANMTVVLAHTFETVAVNAGVDPDLSRTLRRQLLKSVTVNLEASSTVDSLTGPIARGDVQTVERHLGLLQLADERFSAAYRMLGQIALDIVRARGDLTDEKLNDLKRALNGP